MLVRFSPFFFQDFEDACYGFTDVSLQLVDRFALGVTTGQCGDFGPVTPVRILMDDDGVGQHASILALAEDWPCEWR